VCYDGIYTDEYAAYDQLKVHEQVKHSVKEYARGDIHKTTAN
jgi:hypothetical protein